MNTEIEQISKCMEHSGSGFSLMTQEVIDKKCQKARMNNVVLDYCWIPQYEFTLINTG